MKKNNKPYLSDRVLYESIQHAHSELEQANNLFNQLTDDDAIDYASYNLLAARTKYTYLLKLAKESRLTV